MLNIVLKGLITITISLLVIPGLYAQINTEVMRRQALQSGLSGEFSLQGSYKKGNTNVFDLGSGLRLDYFLEKYHFFSVASYTHGEKDDQKYENKGFVHVRGLRQWNKHWMTEIFIQEEFNEFLRLSERTLLGSGFRIALPIKNEKAEQTHGHIFFGLGAMWERERYRDQVKPNSNLLRSTNYLSMHWKLSETVSSILTIYYQVAVNQINDYRILAESGLSFKLFGNVEFKIQMNYRFDNEPPPQVKKYDIELKNGILVRF